MDKKFLRRYARIPAYDELAEATRLCLLKVDLILRDTSDALGQALCPNLLPPSHDRECWATFEHDLSFAFEMPKDADDHAQAERSYMEKELAVGMFDDFEQSIAQSDEDAFFDFLRQCCVRFSVPQEIRQGDVRTNSDRGGYVQFPPAAALRSRLAEVFRILHAKPGESILFRSLVPMVLITNAHAFSDGNGRLSRLLFNLSLWHEQVPKSFYFPWLVFFSRSRGGMLLRVRQAEIHGAWDDLVVQLCTGIKMGIERCMKPAV